MPVDRYAVLGDPVAHSLSPAMHTAAFRAAGRSASYQAIRVEPAELGCVVRDLARNGFHGFNVTIPHKRSIVPILDRLDAAVEVVGAANTVVVDGSSLLGYNTDIEGFAGALDELAGGRTVRRAVVLGAGGAARAVIVTLLARDVEVAVFNRTIDRAHELVRALGEGQRLITLSSPQAVLAALAATDLVVNATSLGMGGQARMNPLPEGAELCRETLVMDLVYGRETPFLIQAKRAGCRTQDGIEMLVRQGAEAFRLWTGLEPDIEVMRSACLQSLQGTAR